MNNNMEIKTKFSLKDTVWTVRDCKVVCFEVNCIILENNTILYSSSRYGASVPEAQCFATRDELIASLCTDGNENV